MAGRGCKYGDYVEYVPSLKEFILMPEETGYPIPQKFHPSNNTLWRVFDGEDDNGDIVLLSDRNIGSVTFMGKIGFAKGPATLDRLCNAYVNPQYAVSGSCLGATEATVLELNPECCSFENVYNASSQERDIYTDNNYLQDVNWIRRSGLMKNSNRDIWLPARHTEELSFFHTMQFGMTIWNGYSNEKGVASLYIAYQAGGGYEYQSNYGVRAKVLLRRDVRFNGEGTKTRPYTLVV